MAEATSTKSAVQPDHQDEIPVIKSNLNPPRSNLPVPLEIRNRIFDYVLNSDSDVVLTSKKYHPRWRNISHLSPHTHTALLRVNSEIARESLSLFRFFIVTVEHHNLSIMEDLTRKVPVFYQTVRKMCSITVPVTINIHNFGTMEGGITPPAEQWMAIINMKYLSRVVDYLNSYQATLPSSLLTGNSLYTIDGISILYHPILDKHSVSQERKAPMNSRHSHPDSNLRLLSKVHYTLSNLRLKTIANTTERNDEIAVMTTGIIGRFYAEDLRKSKLSIHAAINRPVYTQAECLSKAIAEKGCGDKEWKSNNLTLARGHYQQALCWADLQYASFEPQDSIDVSKQDYPTFVFISDLLIDHGLLDAKLGYSNHAYSKIQLANKLSKQRQQVKTMDRLRHVARIMDAFMQFKYPGDKYEGLFLHLAKEMAKPFVDGHYLFGLWPQASDEIGERRWEIQGMYDSIIDMVGEKRRGRRQKKRLWKEAKSLRAATQKLLQCPTLSKGRLADCQKLVDLLSQCRQQLQVV